MLSKGQDMPIISQANQMCVAKLTLSIYDKVYLTIADMCYK